MAIDTAHPHLLPCGRKVEDVFATLSATPANAHEQSCPHCQSARQSLSTLMGATRALIDEAELPSPSLADRIMNAVRAELRRGDSLSLPSDLGPAFISEDAVAAVLRFAADGVDGVRARSCRISQLETGTFSIELELAVRFGNNQIDAMVSDVRHRVGAALDGQVGLIAETLTLRVVDVWIEGEA